MFGGICLSLYPMKTCTNCHTAKELSEFYKNTGRGDGLDSRCKSCRKDYVRLHPHDNKARNARLRAEVLAHYGNRCQCCGETTPEFLALDHINNDGASERRLLKRKGTWFLYWIKQQGFPDHLQILCHNCNMAKSVYGQCPHLR